METGILSAAPAAAAERGSARLRERGWGPASREKCWHSRQVTPKHEQRLPGASVCLRRRAGRFRGLRPAPVGMRRAVLDQPPVNETAVRLPPHPLARVERDQRALELGETVER